jgi:hypothetical protein
MIGFGSGMCHAWQASHQLNGFSYVLSVVILGHLLECSNLGGVC